MFVVLLACSLCGLAVRGLVREFVLCSVNSVGLLVL